MRERAVEFSREIRRRRVDRRRTIGEHLDHENCRVLRGRSTTRSNHRLAVAKHGTEWLHGTRVFILALGEQNTRRCERRAHDSLLFTARSRDGSGGSVREDSRFRKTRRRDRLGQSEKRND